MRSKLYTGAQSSLKAIENEVCLNHSSSRSIQRATFLLLPFLAATNMLPKPESREAPQSNNCLGMNIQPGLRSGRKLKPHVEPGGSLGKVKAFAKFQPVTLTLSALHAHGRWNNNDSFVAPILSTNENVMRGLVFRPTSPSETRRFFNKFHRVADSSPPLAGLA